MSSLILRRVSSRGALSTSLCFTCLLAGCAEPEEGETAGETAGEDSTETTAGETGGPTLTYAFPEDFGWGVALAGFQASVETSTRGGGLSLRSAVRRYR